MNTCSRQRLWIDKTPVHFHTYRLEPRKGDILWDLYRSRPPLHVDADRNRLLLHFGDEVQVIKFMSL